MPNRRRTVVAICQLSIVYSGCFVLWSWKDALPHPPGESGSTYTPVLTSDSEEFGFQLAANRSIMMTSTSDAPAQSFAAPWVEDTMLWARARSTYSTSPTPSATMHVVTTPSYTVSSASRLSTTSLLPHATRLGAHASTIVTHPPTVPANTSNGQSVKKLVTVRSFASTTRVGVQTTRGVEFASASHPTSTVERSANQDLRPSTKLGVQSAARPDQDAFTARAPLAQNEEQPRLAILIGGRAGELWPRSLLQNVVGTNAEAGCRVDVFFSLEDEPPGHSPSQARHADPRILGLRGKLLGERLCSWADDAGATNCQAELPAAPRYVAALRNDSRAQALAYESGLRRWTAVHEAWRMMTMLETRTSSRYDQVLVAPANSFWFAPLQIYGSMRERQSSGKSKAFVGYALQKATLMACLLYDGTVLLDHGAAATIFGASWSALSAWHPDLPSSELGPARPETAHTSPIASSGVAFETSDLFPMVLVSTTPNGFPCFIETRVRHERSCYHQRYSYIQSSYSQLYCRHHSAHGGSSFSLAKLLTEAESRKIISALHTTAGFERRPVIVIATDVNMRQMTSNILCNLHDVGAQDHVVLVAAGEGVCRHLLHDRSKCVEIHSTPSSKGGSLEYRGAAYRAIVARKLSIFSLSAISGVADVMLFMDTDVVVFQNPFAADLLAATRSSRVDMKFMLNNALATGAKTCMDFHPKYYNSRGKRRPRFDLNSGLYYVRDSPGAFLVMLHALAILLAGEAEFDGMDQGALMTALKRRPDEHVAHVGYLPCGQFPNGNIFWNHAQTLVTTRLVAVHVNWMKGVELKTQCMRSSGLWFWTSEFCDSRKRLKLDAKVIADRSGEITLCS
mmetsp:Transcript_85726/g.239658  ORF Transcript_85726/g.239658 Transcript_85726/m.239658 type:complete len:852 (+) Transcript_85726:108-2663(+)